MNDDQVKKLINKAWNKLYLLFTQNKELADRLDSWVEANSGAWSIGWDHKRGSTESCG